MLKSRTWLKSSIHPPLGMCMIFQRHINCYRGNFRKWQMHAFVHLDVFQKSERILKSYLFFLFKYIYSIMYEPAYHGATNNHGHVKYIVQHNWNIKKCSFLDAYKYIFLLIVHVFLLPLFHNVRRIRFP